MGRSGATLLWSSSVTGCLRGMRFSRLTPTNQSGKKHTSLDPSAVVYVFRVFDIVRVAMGTEFAQCALTWVRQRLYLFERYLKRNLQGYRIKPHGQLVLVSYVHYCTSTPSLSTSWSRTTLQGGLAPGIPNLQTSFPLRCLQRLSLPYIATRQCHWHDNRYTSGTSTPVLSY